THPCCVTAVSHPAAPKVAALSLHDALPICPWRSSRSHECARGRGLCHSRPRGRRGPARSAPRSWIRGDRAARDSPLGRSCHGCRSEEHTSELQSRENLVCRLLLEKKKYNTK